jgi:hypothetical protein
MKKPIPFKREPTVLDRNREMLEYSRRLADSVIIAQGRDLSIATTVLLNALERGAGTDQRARRSPAGISERA